MLMLGESAEHRAMRSIEDSNSAHMISSDKELISSPGVMTASTRQSEIGLNLTL